MRRFLLTSLLAATGLNVSTEIWADSLCQSGERVIFSCMTKNDKTISLCATGAADNAKTVVHYRFGTGANTELSYPTDDITAQQAFSGRAQMFSGGGGIYLRFSNNNYDYIIYTGTGKGWQMNGVTVLKNKKFAGYLACKNEPNSELSPQMLQDLNVLRDGDDSEFFPGDIPSKLINTGS